MSTQQTSSRNQLRKPQSMIQRRYSEEGNMFLALFGAVAIVGVLGATIMSVMRGPLSSMVEVNRREQAKAEVSLAASLILAGAADTDAAPDGYTEAPAFAAGTITGGGVIPATIGANKTDPWGTAYGYCVWNHGPDMAGWSGMANTLDGNIDTNNTAIAVISAGPDRTFQTTCIADDADDLDGTDYVEPDDGGGDDIVKALSYNEAVGATDGLWEAVGLSEASIDRDLTVTGTNTSSFSGSIAVGAGKAIITDTIEPIDPLTVDYVAFANGIKLGDVPLATSCDAVGDAGILRFNTGVLEMCDGVSWNAIGGDLWTDLTGGRIHYGTAGTEQVGIGTNNPNNTLDVAGTLDASGAVTFGSTLGVTGATTLSSTLGVTGATTLSSTLGVTGATTLSDTLGVTGATTLDSTLDVAGNVDVNGGKFTIDASNGDTLVDGKLSVNADAEITDSLLITSDTADGSTYPLTIHDSGASVVFRIDSNGGILGEGTLDINGGATIDPQLIITSDTADGSTKPLIIRDSGNATVLDVDSDGDVDVAGLVEANDYTWAGNDFTPGNCAAGNFNRWDGTAWVCEVDTDGGASGALTFLDLTDTPDDYTGDASKVVVVNAGETALEFVAASAIGAQDIDDLTDAYTIYDAGTTSNFIMGRTSAAALTAGAIQNLFIGELAGATTANSTAATDYNTAIGYTALSALTTGSFNTALGPTALSANTTGLYNTGVGAGALSSNNTAIFNTAIGTWALYYNTTGSSNTALGPLALFSNKAKSNSTAIGYAAMQNAHDTAVASNANNTAVGYESLRGSATTANNTGTNNVALGYQTLLAATSGGNNTVIGTSAGDSLTTGADNILIGYNVDAPLATTNQYLNIGNILFGDIGTTSTDPRIGAHKYCDENLLNCFVATDVGSSGAIDDLSDAYTIYDAGTTSNFIMGRTAAAALTAGAVQNLFIGELAGATTANSTAATDANTAVGYRALAALTTGYSNTAIGSLALASNTTGFGNIGMGHNALNANTSGGGNIAIGSFALILNTTGSNNTALGFSTMVANTTGANNVAVGSGALQENIIGSNNTAIGQDALFTNTGGDNTSIGASTLYDNITGARNTVLGTLAGSGLETGDNNILIGYAVTTPTNATNEYLSIGNILFGDIGTTSTDPRIGAHKYCDEDLLNCFVATDVGAGGGAISGLTDAAADNTLTNAAWNQIWNWQLTGAETGLAFGETAASTGGGAANQHVVSASTLAASTAMPLYVKNLGNGRSFQVDDEAADTTPFFIYDTGVISINNLTQFNFPSVGAGVYMANGAMFSGDDIGLYESGGDGAMAVFDPTDSLYRYAGGLLSANTSSGVMIGTTTQSAGVQTLELDVEGDIGAINYCDKDGNNCFTPASVGAPTIDGLTDAYTIYDAGTTSNFIMGRTSAAALTAGAIQNLFIGELAGATTANSTAATDANTAVGFRSLRALTSGANNSALGNGSLIANTSGSRNTAIGTFSLQTNITGNDNTAVGYSALQASTGGNNVATGANALYSNAAGNSNVATGTEALYSNTIGSDNTAIGYQTLYSNRGNSKGTAIGYRAMYYANSTAGAGDSDNVAVGYEALYGSSTAASNTGAYNAALGNRTLYSNTTGSNNTASGYYALYSNTTGASNAANGSQALIFNTTGNYNVAVGENALRENRAKSNSTAIGYQAMYYADSTTTASNANNTALGYQALRGSTTAANNSGTDNVALGYQSMRVNTTGAYNNAIGVNSLAANTSGGYNNAMGSSALTSNTTGTSNVAIGGSALLFNTTGSSNVALGMQSMRSNTIGETNTAIGAYAMYTNGGRSKDTAIGYNAMYYAYSDSGANDGGNVAVGYEALRGSTSAASNDGLNNVAIGNQALLVNSGGGSNVAIGSQALVANTISGGNVALGSGTLSTHTSGNNNIAIGSNAGNTNTTGFGNILIGSGAQTTAAGSNSQLNIGDTIYGNISTGLIGIENSAPDVALDVTGSIEYSGTITDVSDKRLKKDIVPLQKRGNMLDKIGRVDTYSFVMKDEKDAKIEFGVMAQELETIFPELVKTADDEMGTKSVNYIGLIAPMIESIKTLKTENETLKTKVAALEGQTTQSLAAMQKQIDVLNKATGASVKKAGFAIENWMLLLGLSALAAGFFFMGRRTIKKPV